MPIKADSPEPISCKICDGQATLFDVVDSGKFCTFDDYYANGLTGEAVYFRRCQNCGLIFTTSYDSFSTDDFNREIYNSAYQLIDPDYVSIRPQRNAEFLAGALGQQKTCVIGLDYGGGNGLAAKIMTEHGWRYHSYDPILDPALNHIQGRANVISAFEVFEHVPNPLAGMTDLASYAAPDCLLIVGTQVTDDALDRHRLGWWYAGPRNGHITLHTRASLTRLFARHGFRYQRTLESSIHIGIRGIPPMPPAEFLGEASDLTRRIRWKMRRILSRITWSR